MKKSLLKKGLSLLLTLAMVSSLLVPVAMATEGHTYSDTHGNWAEEAIERWSDYGILQGNNGKFNPGGNLTRAHMAAILSRLLALPAAEDAGFKDVKAGEWYADAINRCYAAGILLGNGGYANPDQPISRQQAVVMLGRALGIKPVESADLTAYSDAAQVADYAAGYMAAMAEAGIVQGTSETTLSPYANITRAATVTILDRAIEVYANEEGSKVEAEGTGLVLVVADKVKVTAPKGTIVVVAEGVENTKVNGAAVAGGTTYEAAASVVMGGGGGGGGGSVQLDDLTITPQNVTDGEKGGNYQDVTIHADMKDEDVILSDMTINGNLTIDGGGSNTIRLVRCVIRGQIIVTKKGGETPRVLLTETPVTSLVAQEPAIVEAADGKSDVAKVTTDADVTIRGSQTVVGEVVVATNDGAEAAPEIEVSTGAAVTAVTVQIPAVVKADNTASVKNMTANADVELSAGSVETIVVPANIAGVSVNVGAEAAVVELQAQGAVIIAAAGIVNNVTAQKDVTVASGSVSTITVPANTGEVKVKVEEGAAVADVAVQNATGTTITNNGTVGGLTTEPGEAQPDITIDGSNTDIHYHTWTAGERVDADCETNGTQTYKCSECDVTKTHVILATGHSWGEWAEAGDKHERVCEYCGKKDAAAHTWDKGAVTTAATCEKDGVLTYTCSVCEATKTEAIPAIGHKWSEAWTFVDAENHQQICQNDATHKNVQAHTKVVDKAVAPTCVDKGLSEGAHCDVCASVLVKQDEVPALGHDFNVAYSKDETHHWHVCSRCDVTDTKSVHTYDTKDCAKKATCTVCAYVKPAGQHSWNDGVVTTAPTCTEKGVMTYTCTICSATDTKDIAATGHTKVTDAAVAPTCTTAGKKEGSHCAVCGTVLVAQEEIPALGHKEVVVPGVAPTCTTSGVSEGKTCSVCNMTLEAQQYLAPLGHEYSADYSKDESGHWHVCIRCDAIDGKSAHTYDTKDCAKKATCSACGYVKPAGSHSWNDGVVTTAPTCTEKGVLTYTCYICSATDTKDIAATGHTKVTDAAVAPTCTTAGKKEGSHCAVCNTVLVAQEVIPALGHKEVVIPGVAPTCTASGVSEGKTCSVCNTTLAAQQYLAPLGHEYSADYSKDENGHWHVCIRCDAIDGKSGHTYSTTNCAEKATCSACGYVKPAGSHTWNDGYVTVNATCEDEGVMTYTCTSCYATDSKVIPAIGHSWSTWQQYTADQHYRYCTNNTNHIEIVDHAYGDDYTCDDCGYGKSAAYSVFIRHLAKEEQTVENALQIVDGKLQLTIPGYGTYGVGQTLPAITREGWNYLGWEVVVWDTYDNKMFEAENLTEITADVEKALYEAIEKEYLIFLMGRGIPMGGNGFRVETEIIEGDLIYRLLPPAGEEDDVYFLDFFSVDRAHAIPSVVEKESGYEGMIWPGDAPPYGWYGAFEVRDENNNLLAVDTGVSFSIWDGGNLGNFDTPVVSINYAESSTDLIIYEISGLTTKVNYYLESNDGIQLLGMAENGKCYAVAEATEPLSSTAKLWGANVSNQSSIVMETLQPITVSIPTFDPSQLGTGGGGGTSPAPNLNRILAEADNLGLLKYVDATEFAVGAPVTRLQGVMLTAALMGLTPADGAGIEWSFDDGDDLTADEKAIIMVMCKKDILSGYNDNTFRPDDQFTNAAIVKLIDIALGQPVVPVVRTNNVSTDHWVYWNFTMLDNLGILDNVDISVNSAAIADDVLTMFVDAKEWRVDNPENPAYPVDDAFFDGTNLAWGTSYIDSTGLEADNLRYYVSFEGADGNFRFRTGGNVLPLWYAMGGKYDTVIIETYYADRFCGEYETSDLTLYVDETVAGPANVSFTLNGDGTAYRMYITGLESDGQFNIFFGNQKNNFNMGIGDRADANGTFEKFYPVASNPHLAELIETGYFLLREYPGWSINSSVAEMDIVNRGGWTLCAEGSTAAPLSYEVTNIRFVDQYLMWDEPTAAYNQRLDYNVKLSANGGQSWIDNVGTNGTDIAGFSFDPGTYNKMRIETLLEGEDLMASVEIPIDLFIGKNPALAAANVTFEKLTENGAYGVVYEYYKMTATGLTPNTSYIFQIMDRAENWNNGNFQEVVSDANGVGSINFWDTDLVEFGYYSITELVDYSQADDTTIKYYVAQRGETERCFAPTDTAWFEVMGDGSLYFCWDMTPMANAADYAGGYSIYLHDGNDWVRVDGTGGSKNFWRVTSPGVNPGTYTGIKLVGRNADMVHTSTWFEMPVSLTVIAAPSSAEVQFEALSDGTYNVEVYNLASGAEVAEVVVSEHQGLSGSDYMVDGLGGYQQTLFENEEISYPNGYYRIREYSDLNANAQTASFSIGQVGWTQISWGGGGGGGSADPAAAAWFMGIDGALCMEWDAEEPEDINAYNRYCVYLHEVDENEWRLLDIMQFTEPYVLISGNNRFVPGNYDQVRVDLGLVNEYGESVAPAEEWFTAPISLTCTTGASNASAEFVSVGGDQYTATITGLSGAVCRLVVCSKDDEDEYNDDFLVADGTTAEITRNFTYMDEGYYSITEYTIRAMSGNTADLKVWETGWRDAVSGAAGDDGTYGYEPVGKYAVSFYWDYEEPAGFEQVYEYILQFSEDGGMTWTQGVHIPDGETSTRLTAANLEAGSFNMLRMLIVGSKDGRNAEEVWFEGETTFTVQEDPATFDVEFVSVGDGIYDYTISNIQLIGSDNMFYAIEFTDDETNDWMMMGNGGGYYGVPYGGSITEEADNPYVADGYYRVALFYNAVADGNFASVTIQKMDGWTKCSPKDEDGGTILPDDEF